MADGDSERFFEAMSDMLFGKYKGKVVTTRDPTGQGRIEVSVPTVFGDKVSKWARPCVPYAAHKLGWHAIPPERASVWVEFEGGDRDHPIWTGCFWDEGESPPETDDKTVMLKLPGATITITDAGEVEIKAKGGATITLKDSEITLKAPKVVTDAQGGKTEVSAAGFNAQDGAFTVI